MNKDFGAFSDQPISCDIHDFLDIEISETWILKDFLPFGGKMLIWGDTNAGKSPLVATLAQSVLSGTPFLRKIATAQGNVAYFMFPDMSLQEWQDRWEPWRLGGFLPERGQFYTNFHPTNARIDATAKQVRELQGTKKEWPSHLKWVQDLRSYDPILVIVDVITQTHDRDMNDGLVPKLIYNAWRTVTGNRPGIVFTHHERKALYATLTGKKVSDPKHSFSGHMDWLNLVSGGIEIAKEGNRFLVNLSKERKGDGTTVFPIHLNTETMLFDIGDNHWGRAWKMLEKGVEPDEVAMKICTEDFNLTKAQKLVGQVVKVLDAQAEIRREQNVALV